MKDTTSNFTYEALIKFATSLDHFGEISFNPFLPNVPIFCPLKTLENQRLSGVLWKHWSVMV